MSEKDYDSDSSSAAEEEGKEPVNNSDSSEDLDDEEPFDFSNLPAHACTYCGIHDVDSVVKCKETEQWLCNNKGALSKGSHIIIHLVKSKSKEIALHPDNPLGVANLECYVCGNKNIFLLGFVPLEESQVLIVCRMPCLNTSSSEFKWDPNEFSPLVQEKALAEWLVKPSSESVLRRARTVTMEQINAIEELRKTNPNVKFEDINRKTKEKKLKPVLLRYEDGHDYCDTFLPLIKAEANHDKKVKEMQTQSGIKVRWEMSLRKKRLAFFVFSSKEDFDTNLLPGNELKLSCKDPNWSAKGHVVKVTTSEEVCLELDKTDVPTTVNSDFVVEFVWKSTSFNRMKNGVRRFYKDTKSISSYLYYRLLGHESQAPEFKVPMPKIFSAPGLPELNVYQVDAVKKALKSPLCLIQGPPGTGKTVTSASIIYHLVQNIQRSKGKGQILVCAPSNIVVDQLADKIHQTGLKVVRLCSKSREAVSTNIEFLTLHSQIRNLMMSEYYKLNAYFKLLDDQGELTKRDEEEFDKLRKKAEMEILESADVICCTCITSADPRLRDFQFQHVLIDEATQAIEPECILPLLKGCQQVMLVGDHRQLGPVITCRETKTAGLDKSLFVRLVSMGIRPVRLQVQYRMHPALTVFPSNTFYEGTLQNGITISDRIYESDFPWPSKTKPMFFFNLLGVEEISASGTSFVNRPEATQVEKIVNQLLRTGVKAINIGIITPYKGQRAYIVNYLQKNGSLNPEIYKAIEVASVDGFQGREKDYIIISCVRSNDGLGIGFLTDPRRLNVTLTRARFGVIICGNAKVLARDNLWNSLLYYFKENEVLVEGNLMNLKQSMLKFRPPQRYVPERRHYNQPPDFDNRSMTSYSRANNNNNNDNLNNFDTESQHSLSLAGGYRESEFGFHHIPDMPAFSVERFARKEKSIAFDEESKQDDDFSRNGDDEQLQHIGTFLPQEVIMSMNSNDPIDFTK